MLHDQEKAVRALRTVISDPSYQDLIQASVASKRLVFCGVRAAQSVAEYAALGTRRIGRTAIAVTGGGHALAGVLVQLDPSDCAVTHAPLVVRDDIRLFTEEGSATTGSSFVLKQRPSDTRWRS